MKVKGWVPADLDSNGKRKRIADKCPENRLKQDIRNEGVRRHKARKAGKSSVDPPEAGSSSARPKKRQRCTSDQRLSLQGLIPIDQSEDPPLNRDNASPPKVQPCAIKFTALVEPSPDTPDTSPPGEQPRATDDTPPVDDIEPSLDAPDTSLPEEQPRGKDYASPVREKELSPLAPIITWPGGTQTVVPFIPKSRSKKKVNLLQVDEDAVRRFSKFPESRDSQFIVHIPYSEPVSTLATTIRGHLSRGQTVVIDNAESVKEFEFSLKNIIKERKLTATKPYCIHYARERVNNFSEPQKDGNIARFFGLVSKRTEIACILDLPSAIRESPSVINQLDDGLPADANFKDLFASELYCLKDTHDTRNWELMHTGGFHTFEHHDAEGYATFLRIVRGCKMWGIARPAGYDRAKTQEELDTMNKMFIRSDNDESKTQEELDTMNKMFIQSDSDESWILDWEKKGGELYTIIAEPGSLVIMPPGAWHQVYTPIGTYAVGGHIYLYDTLHLTEVSRRFDRNHALEVTNTSHISAYMTLCIMMCNVVRTFREITFYRKPIHALCRMVLCYEEYIVQDDPKEIKEEIKTNANKLGQCKLAKIIAQHLVDFFGFDLASQDYLFVGGWLEPGPIIELEDACAVFTCTAILPDAPGKLKASLEDILEGKWVPKCEPRPNSAAMKSKSQGKGKGN